MIDGASLGSILLMWLAVAACGILALPLCSLLFPNDADRGYLAAKPIGWIIGAYVAWLAAVLGVPFNRYGWIVGFAALALIAALALPRARRLSFPPLRRLLLLELAFLLLLVIGALIKARVPD